MNVNEIISAGIAANKAALSCEFFPPKTDKGEANLWQCIQELQPLKPTYVSVTYGAGGTTQERTQRIISRLCNETDLTAVAHLTCVGANKTEIAALLDEYHELGLQNILALRGDAPQDMDSFQATDGGFSYATDLIDFIHQRGDFCVGGATYPEGHPESKGGVNDDLRYLKIKQDNGASFAITQYFFDNDAYFRFRDSASNAGINIPIIPGIMTIGNYAQIVRFSGMCGAQVPDWLHARLQPLGDDSKAVFAAGVDIAVKQCAELLAQDAPGLHFYTLNKSAATLAVAASLGHAIIHP
ncbi:MAG: methylenetetrahydrofolate reductase [NAD(P)H] [Mariprofundales bacterium]